MSEEKNRKVVEEAPKKKKGTNVVLIILAIILGVCALVGGIGFWALNKVKNTAENVYENMNSEEKAEEFEKLQKEITDITRQVADGEISEEEGQQKILELQEKATKLMLE